MPDKAALFGVNQYKHVSSLQGCVNDVENVKSVLTGVLGFSPRNVRTFADAAVTKAEVLRQLKWLFRDVAAGDRVVFHLSAHGSNVADDDGDEPDGQDEIFCMHDMDFDDPGSYLLDDELREWTETLPAGVRLLVILDTCHSGTGTRMLLSRGLDAGPPMLVDDVATLKRGLAAHGGTERGIDAAAAALRPDHPDVVRARYVEPPAAVLAEIAAARAAAAKPRKRGFVKAPLNHVLLAACRDDQTAADATIDGRPVGAFSHYLCEALRAEGTGVARRTLIDRVGKALADGWFSQVPQLEAKEVDVPLFDVGGASDSAAGEAPSAPSAAAKGARGDDAPDPLDLLARIVGDGGWLDAAARGKALDVLSGIHATRSAAAPTGRGLPGRVLVPVHGICRHDAGYSDGWWTSLHPFTTVYGEGRLGESRQEVLWSDLVNGTGRAAARGADERAEFAAKIRSVLEERTAAEVLEDAPESAEARDLLGAAEGRRGLDLLGLDCIDDFTVYMFDDKVRAQVIARFTSVVRPLLERGAWIDVLSHSWGTVVAYEGLRELESSFGAPLVRDFFTVGSALSIFLVKSRLRPANKDGRKPGIVGRWINLNATGDPVGGALKGRPFQVDEEWLGLPNMGCGLVSVSCSHNSYFQPSNVTVNRDVFARNINAV